MTTPPPPMNTLLAHYINVLQPEIFKITESFGPKWYGLAYIGGFVCAYLLMVWMAKRKIGQLKPEEISDFIFMGALFGVMLGGRIGYVLFYQPQMIIEEPMSILKLWDGGMSSHGGILGLMVFTFFYARKRKISWPGIGDNLVVVTPLGILFGRLANFINGELYGHVSDVAWAVKFPNEFLHGDLSENHPEQASQIFRTIAEMEPQLLDGFGLADGSGTAMMERMRENDAFREAVGEFLNPRHPSQLYEGILEGLVLFAILFAVRVKWRNAPFGMITGLFFILYAVFRIIVENYRVPDAELIAGLTRGQFYSLPMILVGVGFLIYALRGKKQNPSTT